VTFLQAAVALAAAPCGASAGGIEIDHPYGDKIYDWRIGYSETTNGCVAAREFGGHTTMWLGVGDSRLGAYLAFSDPDWSWIEVGKIYELRLTAAPYGDWRGSFIGVVSEKRPGLASLALSAGFQYDLTRAYVLAVDLGPAFARAHNDDPVLRISLNGAAAALRAVSDCQSSRGAAAGLADPRAAGGAFGPVLKEARRTGSGFFVSTDGDLLTNSHVVEGCLTAQLRFAGSPPQEGQVRAADKGSDLALIHTGLRPVVAAALRADAVVGESVEVYGFPLSDTLSRSGSFTVGNVSAAAGAGDDARTLQTSAPVQPGNSGGPLLDQSGAVVGVVQATFDPGFEPGAPTQNVNFAIKASVAISFLRANGVEPEIAVRAAPVAPAAIAARAKLFTVQVACHPRPTPRPVENTPQQKRIVVRLTQPVRESAAPDMSFGDAAPREIMPEGAVFELPYARLFLDCRPVPGNDVRHRLFCPITFHNRVSWVDALFLDTPDGRLACVIDPASISCEEARK
jgi:S1-C subfamily serine protease